MQLRPNLLYGKDYVIVPPRVWLAFKNWYGRTMEIKRKVIMYPLAELSLRSTTTLQSLQTMKGTQLNEQ